jgi:hypothetical protein
MKNSAGNMFSVIGDLTVNGPKLEEKDDIGNFDVSGDFVKQMAVHMRRQTLLDFWSLIKGELPPVNNIGYHEKFEFPKLKGLLAANALFKGIKRPHGADDNGDNIYIFICPHKHMYRLIADMVCLAKYGKSPENAVFACYVRRYAADAGAANCGMILAWEWLKSDVEDPSLPNDWQARYETEIWRR